MQRLKSQSVLLIFMGLLSMPGYRSPELQKMNPTPALPFVSGFSAGTGSLETFRQVPDDKKKYELIFPQCANGELGEQRLKLSIILLNNSNTETSAEIQFFKNDGSPMTLSTDLGELSNLELNIGRNQTYVFESDGMGPLVAGWARVTSKLPLAGTATYHVSNVFGEFLSEAGISNSPPSITSMVPVSVSSEGNTAVAICSPGSDPAILAFSLRTNTGELIGEASSELQTHGQVALFVTELFPHLDLSGFQGVLSLTSDHPVSQLALKTVGINYTALGASDPESSEEAPYIFTRIGDGVFGDLRLQSIFLILNSEEVEASARLEFYKASGEPLGIDFGSGAQAVHNLTIAPQGALFLYSAGTRTGGEVGWARMTTESNVLGSISYRITDANDGSFMSEVAVPASKTSPQNLVYVRGSTIDSTAVAFTNPSEANLGVTLSLAAKDSSSNEVFEDDHTLILPAGSHIGSYVTELFPELSDRQFEGQLRIDSYNQRFGPDIPSPLALMTLLARETRLTSLPAAPLSLVQETLDSWDPDVEFLLSQMTLDEKIGQMTQADRSALASESDIATYFLGSILSGGGSGPPNNHVDDWSAMYDRFQEQALSTRLSIPILYGIDAVHGHNNVYGAVIFPHNIGLGATGNPELVEMVTRITATEVRATGMNWTFSPCVAVPRDERWGRTYEGFSEDPQLVHVLGRAAVKGYQGELLRLGSSIAACAKHYIGDGGTTWNTGLPIDQGDTQIDEETLRQIHLPGYLGAMEAGVATIMVSFSSWNGLKLSAHEYLVNDVLKNELGFKGLLISDWAAIDQLPGTYRDQVRTSINAGLDMIMVPHRYRKFIQTLRDLAISGEVSEERIDDAVRRILRVKFSVGLFDRSPLTNHMFKNRFGSEGHREVGREAVRQSVVLLKNESGLLPLSKENSRILVTGRNAHDLGNQCGGWTITWQGLSGPITEGTTILHAVKNTVSDSTEVVFDPEGTDLTGADVAIVVVGESPYAESLGDSANLALSSEDQVTIGRVTDSEIPTVLVLISGRPLILGDVANKVDAILAAWLPGTEGQGVADVLFGDYSPTGKLPCTWPREMSQIPINVGDPDIDPLYPIASGLTYD